MKLIKRVRGGKEKKKRKKKGKRESRNRAQGNERRRRVKLKRLVTRRRRGGGAEPTGRNSLEWQFLLAHTERVVAFTVALLPSGRFVGGKTRRISVGI